MISVRLQRFRPLQLLRVLEKVKRDHPNRLGVERVLPRALLAEVRELLLDTPDEDLEPLSRRLTTVQLRACLSLLALAEEDVILRRAGLVLRMRPRRDLLPKAWGLLVQSYPAQELEDLIRALGPMFEWKPLLTIGPPERFESWFSSPRLTQGLIADFLRGSSPTLGEWLGEVGVPRDSKLVNSLVVEMVREGDRALWERIGVEKLFKWAARQRVAVHQIFGQRYLQLYPHRREWVESIAEWILERFESPVAGVHQTPFWRPLSEEVRRQFLAWVDERELRDYFERVNDPQGRYQFWLQFLDYLDGRVQIRWAGQEPVLFIEFESFGVIEFSQKGNAAYVYSKDDFRRFRSMDFRRPKDLKNPEMTIRRYNPLIGQTVEGRILHTSDWENRYTPWIYQLLGRRPRR